MAMNLVIDSTSGGILLHVPTSPTAYAVAQGIAGSYNIKAVMNALHGVNVNDSFYTVYRNTNGTYKSSPMLEEKITGRFKELKILAKLRGKAIYSLELFLNTYLDRTDDFYDKELNDIMVYALQGCDIENNIYSDAITEYASVMEIPLDTAYYEIRLRIENHGIIKLKNYARFKKYTSIINSLTTAEDIEKQMEIWHTLHSKWTR